jgi:hypothetical protein
VDWRRGSGGWISQEAGPHLAGDMTHLAHPLAITQSLIPPFLTLISAHHLSQFTHLSLSVISSLTHLTHLTYLYTLELLTHVNHTL